MSRPDIPGFPTNQDRSVTQTDYRTPTTEPTMWAAGPQRPVVSEGEQRSILAAAGMVGAAVFAAGAIPLPGQKGVAYAQKTRVWDKYIGAAKFAERASPAQILSTFRISEALSPLERVASGKTTWGGQFWDDPSRQKYLGKLLGKDVFTKHKDDILSRGLILSEGKLKVGADVAKGQGPGATVLTRANKLRTHKKLGQAEFFKNYVRAIGADDLKFSTKEFLPIGGRNIAHAYARFGYTSATEMTNRILRVSPTEIAELPVMRDLADKIKSKVGPKVQGSLAAKTFNKVFPEIKPGAAHQTIGRYLTRRVLPAVALWKGFQLADYATGNMISGTVLGGYAQANVMKAKLMEATGMQEYATRQEEIAPGSTSLLGLSAFPLKGAMLGFGAYGARLAYTAREAMKPGVGAAEAALTAANKFKEKNYNTFFGIGKKLGFKQRNLSSALRRTGGLLGLAFAAPFLPGAIAGTETSEDLEAIYSGEKEVAIRKGRWWEAGRCNASESLIFLDSLNYKFAKDIAIGDTLLGADGQSHNIVDIYTRHHNERILKFKTVLDRNIETGLTENHMVQVLKGKDSDGDHVNKEYRREEFVEAGSIEIGDFVQVPIPALKESLVSIDASSLIRTGKYIKEDGYVYSAQMNWITGNTQKSGGNKIPDKIILNEDIGRLFGYFIAEGNLSFKNDVPSMIETVHAVSEKWIVDDIVEICEKHFDVTPTFKHRKNFTKCIEGAWIVRICNSLLARVFFELFYKSNRVVDKFIPEAFLDAPNSFKLALVEGYWRGDGHIEYPREGKNTKERYIISSTRKQLIDFARIVLLANGIAPTTPKTEVPSVSGWKDRYRIGWTPGTEYADVQGFQWIDGKLYTRIFSIEEEDYDDTVYDFEIDHEEHLIVNGTFLVHNSPYEGGRIQYFRKHFIPSYLSRGKVKALYGTEGQKILSDPIYNPVGYLMDPYKWEKEHYYEFPFPVTAPAFEDVPFIGPMLASTIGQIIKPSKLMHTEEWMRPAAGPAGFGPAGFGPGMADPGQLAIPIGQMKGELEGYGYGPGQMEVKRLPRAFGEISAYDLGEIPRGIPVDPYSPTQAFGEQSYRLTEMFGLPGYSLTVAKGMLTGTEEFYDQYERLESSSRATGIERAYWDLQIGGGALSTELFRRLFPHRRRGIDLFNPIKNTMPGWLPGPGQPSPDFQHGFAFGKILEGELRLPGRGMEALYPELEGIDPQDYSLMWRYKILSDVSPYSPQTKFYKRMVQGLRKQGTLSERDEQLYETIQDQLQQKKVFKKFREHKQFIDSETETRTVTISKMIEPGKFEIEEMPGVTVAMAGLKTSQSAFSRMAIKENNELTQQEAGIRANQKRMRASQELADLGVAAGTQVEIEITGDVLRQYAKAKSDRPEIRAVVRTGEGVNLNRMLLEAELAEYDKASAGVLEGQVAYNKFEQLVGAYWETGIRAIDDPSEYLTPISPFHKMLGTKTRTAVEEYAAAESYGTSAAFWDKPWDNFLRPAINYAAYKYLGARELPQHIKERNEIEEYFDKLKYIKFTKLKNAALTQGDTEAAEEYEKVRRRTAFGADPYGNPLNGLLAMQKRDKPYFDAFARASTESERELIMDMLPKHERHLVQARWNLDMMNQLFAERKVKGSLSTEQHEMLEELHKLRISEGQAVDPSAMAAYKSYENNASEEIAMSYADFQRERALEDYFKSHPLPRNDFVGWCLPSYGEIMTESGIKCADKIVVGDSMLQSNGHNKVLKIFTRETSEDMYSIKSVAGSYKQECTENHKLLIAKPSKCIYKRVIADYKDKTISNDRCVPRSNKQCRACKKSPDINVEWTAAENVSVNDYIVFGKPVYSDDPENIDLLDYFDVDDPKIKFDDEYIWLYFADKRNKINRFILSDYKLGYLVGLYMAEGHLGRTAAKTVSDVRLTHHIDEREYANKFCKYIKDVFGVETVRIYNRHRDTGDSLNTQINSTLLAMLFDRLCGQHCDKKRVKENALFNNKFNIGFLAGSLLGDGGKTEKKRIRFAVTSKEFAMQVRRVAMSIGFLPSIIYKTRDMHKDSWLVEIPSYNTDDFYMHLDNNDADDLIDLATNTHTSDKFLIDNSLFYRIKDVSAQEYSGTVYDFNVENVHEYECFGGTYHNSPMTDLEDIKLVVVKNEGKDMHDFNLWESREKTLPYKPYIDEDAIEQVTHMEGDMSAGDMRAALHDILASYGVENVNITVDKFLKKDPQNIIDLDITRDSLQIGFENAVKEGWI